MTNYETKISQAKQYFSVDIEEEFLLNILFEMNRYYDKTFVLTLHNENFSQKLNQYQRNLLRKYYYYGISDWLEEIKINSFPKYTCTEDDKIEVLNSFLTRCVSYDTEKIVNSVLERYTQVKTKTIKDNSKSWLDWHQEKIKKEAEYSLYILDYSQEDFIQDNYDINAILKNIASIYDKLENYRYFIFKLAGKLFNKDKEDVTWQILYKIGIYCENFISFTEPFFPFKKEKSKQKLLTFLQDRFFNENLQTFVDDFYNQISTGFKFEDCLISDTQSDIILTFKKIKLDLSPIPCPSCMTTIQSGNSFPELFLRSYECKNPNCPERSKSGRGKRFDEFGVYRYFKLTEDKKENKITEELYTKWRKDIFSSDNNIYEMLINFYAWDNETVCFSKQNDLKDFNCRKVITKKFSNQTSYCTDFEKLPIVKFFKEISNILTQKTGEKLIEKNLEILNENSTEFISNLKVNQIGTAITSPPYYNAREYSQWTNLIFYFIDMQRNAKGIFNTLCDNGYYLYNIGDIVNTDNIYVESNMSKKRLQLGFLSCLIFEQCGFNLVGNIIWDKGEVQSKRNSTMNRNSGYVKCINCYEHMFVFKKGKESNVVSAVHKITPVIKINSKGENLYKHTAPYPLELVNLVKPFVMKDKYVLDPFLGSGTTLKWCKKNNFKGIGFELNKEYFKLAKENIEKIEEPTLFDEI